MGGRATVFLEGGLDCVLKKKKKNGCMWGGDLRALRGKRKQPTERGESFSVTMGVGSGLFLKKITF